jgi:hypothetical protein
VGGEGKGEVHLEVNVATCRISRGADRGQTSDGALTNAALTTGNGDDLLHIWNASLGRETATRHCRGFAAPRKALTGSQLVPARWRKLGFRYERVVMAQSTQGTEESLHSRSHTATNSRCRDTRRLFHSRSRWHLAVTWHDVHFSVTAPSLLLSRNVCRVFFPLRDLTSVL